ncbi:hypothetical protein [Phocaeicola sp.]
MKILRDIQYPQYFLVFYMVRAYLSLIYICCFLVSCSYKEKQQSGALSYKEVKTEVLFCKGEEDCVPDTASDITARLDTINWHFRDKHGYLQPSMFVHIDNKTCGTLSVDMQELYKMDNGKWRLLPCSVSQTNFGNVIPPPGMVWSNYTLRFCFNGYDLEPNHYMLRTKMVLLDSKNSGSYCLEVSFVLMN